MAMAISPWPLMKTIGIRAPRAFSSSWSAGPLVCAMRTSSTRQPGCPALKLSRNSCAERNVAARRPTEVTSSAIESKTAVSSSTMNTVGSDMSSVSSFRDRQRELEHASASLIGSQRQPTAVRFNNVTGDRKPHPQSSTLGRIERIENMLGIVGRNSGSAIGDAYGDFIFCRACDSHFDDATGDSSFLDGLNGIARQV